MCDQNSANLEIILGIVSPIGTDKTEFIKLIRKNFLKKGYAIEEIKVTDILVKKAKIIPDYEALPKSLQYFTKMQICSELRRKNKGLVLQPVFDEIVKKRASLAENKKVVYIIDQLKNKTEYKILSHVYGLNYIQASLFSNYEKRNNYLQKKFKGDLINNLSGNDITVEFTGEIPAIFKEKPIKIELSEYCKEILPDASSTLIAKDFSDITEEFKKNKTGQEVSELFHKSHYFFNLDVAKNELENEVEKFVNLIQGEHKQYPTQDEFGMSLAANAKFRSNFPGDRQIGAAILSPYGEVISVASIRAPTPSANTTYADEVKIREGYKKFHSDIEEWINYLGEVQKNEKCDAKKQSIRNLKKFINDSLEYHPCTHAEIAAILDAAKLGVSIRNATLYTTTFPCHICAKDIITVGIKEVIYLEAYPKSKNSELYPDLILFDSASNNSYDGIPFKFYVGISPKRFSYVYDSINQPDKKDKEDKENKCSENLPPLLKYEISRYYQQKEAEVNSYLKGDKSNLVHLTSLFDPSDEDTNEEATACK